MIEFRDDTDDMWHEFVLAPDWEAMKVLADKWQLDIRMVNDATGLVEREYYPLPPTLPDPSVVRERNRSTPP